MSPTQRNLGIGTGLSAAVHALAALLLSLVPAPIRAAAPTQEVLLVVSARTERADEMTTSTPTFPTPAPTPTRPGPHRPAPTPRAPSPIVLPAPIDVAPIETPTVPAPSRPEPDLHRLLEPARVAGDYLTSDATGPTMPGPPAPRELAPTGPVRSDEEAVAAVARDLAEAARARPFHPREAPRLTLRPDGSRTWRGPNFGVVIRPDGEVEFSDQSSLAYDWTRAEGTFDLEAMVMELAGQDPFVAERIWFMESTAGVREQLEDRAREQRSARVLQRLDGQLARIWQDETRSLAERRRALFEIWDGAAEDESGRAARDAVLGFVRAELGAGSDAAYSPMELARLNATRESAERFAPY